DLRIVAEFVLWRQLGSHLGLVLPRLRTAGRLPWTWRFLRVPRLREERVPSAAALLLRRGLRPKIPQERQVHGPGGGSADSSASGPRLRPRAVLLAAVSELELSGLQQRQRQLSGIERRWQLPEFVLSGRGRLEHPGHHVVLAAAFQHGNG